MDLRNFEDIYVRDGLPARDIQTTYTRLLSEVMNMRPVEIGGALATPGEVRQRVTHLRILTQLYSEYMAAAVDDLNQRLPVTEKADIGDFCAVVSDSLSDLLGPLT